MKFPLHCIAYPIINLNHHHMKISVAVAVFCIAFLSCQGIYAQNTFAPPGSEWYHAMGYGVFHDTYKGDTIIAGKPCSIV